MIESLAKMSRPILEFPLIQRIRRNHGLEHATIHMLSRKVRNLRIAGRADDSGFYLYGDADTDTIYEAVAEALQRMRAGESKWAVHPNCGTGLVTTGFMTSGAAVLGLTGAQSTDERVNRFPLVVGLSIIALVLSQPMGLQIQRYFTTSGEPGDLELDKVTRHESRIPFLGRIVVHRVHTRKG